VFDDTAIGALPMPLDTAIPVLVVDDSETMQRVVCKLLQQLGFEKLECAGNGLDALQKLHEKKIGLVISDWYMHPMDGLTLTHRIRAEGALRHIPVILISSVANADNVIDAKEAGVVYIVKPFSAAALKAKIENAMAAH
jgi:two-component system chemotaxis response regulator CheY